VEIKKGPNKLGNWRLGGEEAGKLGSWEAGKLGGWEAGRQIRTE